MEEVSEVVSGDVKAKDKKPRKRMKAICSRIKEQMEFYFSDSNLNRDRFMKKQIDDSKDGFIDLELFLKFNKIKELTLDTNVIASALKNSELLQVSEDARKVRRTKPISSSKDVDERTVYVECLPHNVNHEWIKRVFSSCGTVLYISIPKYKSTGDTKGFAFIEFNSREAACKACEELNNPPAEACDKPGKFPRTSKQLTHLQKAVGSKEETSVEHDNSLSESPTKSGRKKKRRRQTSECSNEGGNSETVSKHRKLDFDKEQSTEKSKQELNVSKTSETDEKESTKKKNKKRKRSKGEGQSSVTESETSDQLSVDESDRENRKRKQCDCVGVESEPPAKITKEDKNLEDKENSEKFESSAKEGNGGENVEKKDEDKKKKKKRNHKSKNRDKDIPELRVISKKEWLGLKSEYLKLQKESMNKLKKTLTQIHKDQTEKDTGNKEHKTESKEKHSDRPQIEFVPDVIVGINSGRAMHRKEVKEDLGADYQIAYIDLKEGDKSGYIRMKDSDSAKKLAEASSGSYFFSLLQGQEEKDYWDKLQSDRNSKFNTKTNKKKKGSEKLIEKAQKIARDKICKSHIKFDD